MPKLLLLLLLTSNVNAYCQHNFFVFKKRHKTITVFTEGSTIAFMLSNQQWYAGQIKHIENDSFYFLPVATVYNLHHPEPMRFSTMHIALADVYAMPKDGMEIDYVGGEFIIRRDAGHVHFYWVKGGWLFRTLGAGYALLNVTNKLIYNNPPFTADNTRVLAICAGVFAFGEILKYSYKPYWELGNKYHLEYR